MNELAAAVRRREPTAVARALNLIEDGREASRSSIAALLDALRDARDAGHRVGLTGAPGVGKSTLAGALASEWRRRETSIAVVAVDPSSPRSGGSLLGDRARMNVAPDDPGVFVRSLATGGRRGGLSWATHAACRVLGAGYQVVLVETTGVGQSETDVRTLADTVVLVLQPGGGDALQFLKAGIMEIPDVLVVNKADLDRLAESTLEQLVSALRALGRDPVVLATSATEGRGVDQLVDAIDARGVDPEHRRESDVAWTLDLFRHRHGEHGVDALGGERSLRRFVADHLDAHAPPELCAQLSARYLEPPESRT